MTDVYYVRNGMATILNYVEFDSEMELETREGSDKDADALYHTFLNLGFTFYSARCNDPLKNLRYGLRNGTSGETQKLLTELASEKELENCDCLVVVVASHGEIGCFFTYDGNLSIREELVSRFDMCHQLNGKPKLFFMQTCRIENTDDGMNSFHATREIIGHEPDILVSYSTISGKRSNRHPNIGSWFLDELSKCFNRYAATKTLDELLKEVRRNVADKHHASCEDNVVEQCTSTVDQLFRTLKFVANLPQVAGGETPQEKSALTERLILKGVPFFDNYVARNDEESNIRKGLLNLTNRDCKNSKGFCFVVHGSGGIGKSTLVAHVMQKSQDYLTQTCKIQIVTWLNCYKWRDGFNDSDRKPDEFFRELLELGRTIVKEQEESEKGDSETKGGDFVSVTQMINHFAKKGQRILFVLDDVFHYSILSSLRMQCNSSISLVLTRDASVLEIPASGSATFLECSDVENPLLVGYFTDERVSELFSEGSLKGKLNEQQLNRLVQMSCGLPLIVSLILGHFKQKKYKSNSERAFKDLTEKLKLGEFQVDSIVLGRNESRAKQLFDFSFQSLSAREKESYFVFLLFDPAEEVDFKWLKELWQIEDDFDAREICDSFEGLSLVRHTVHEPKYSWERMKDCYLVHQILWEQTLENSKEHYQLAAMPNIPLIQTGRIQILTNRTAIDAPSDRILKLLINLNLFTSQSVLDAILSHIKDDELGSWCDHYELRKIPQLSEKYEKQLISAARTNHAFLTRLLLENGANTEAKDEEGSTPLICASQNGHPRVAKWLIEKGADIEAKNDYAYTALIWACENGHIEVVKLLIESGADIEAMDKGSKKTSLILASQNGHIDVVKWLIEKGAGIEVKSGYGYTPLILASFNGHIEVVKWLIERGADIKAKDADGNTPLISASKRGHIEVVKWLIELGDDIEAKDKYCKTSLSWASQHRHLEVVKWLIERGADIETKSEDGDTPLILASGRGKIEVMKLLMENGADIEAKANDGYTSLLYASVIGQFESVKLLVESGANLEAKEKDGSTPLISASQNGEVEIAKWLIERGADIEAKNENGNTPLTFSSLCGKVEVVKLLIECGADIEANDKNNKTPMILASQDGHLEIVKLLIEKGARVEAKDKRSNTPLISSSKNGHLEVVKWLIEKGANIEAKEKEGNTPLILASKNGHIEVVKWLIEKGSQIEATDKSGKTALISTSLSGHIEVVKWLIENGSAIEAKDWSGATALSAASRTGKIEVVRWLIERGADIETKDKGGKTPLIWASIKGHVELAKWLTEKGAKINTDN